MASPADLCEDCRLEACIRTADIILQITTKKDCHHIYSLTSHNETSSVSGDAIFEKLPPELQIQVIGHISPRRIAGILVEKANPIITAFFRSSEQSIFKSMIENQFHWASKIFGAFEDVREWQSAEVIIQVTRSRDRMRSACHTIKLHECLKIKFLCALGSLDVKYDNNANLDQPKARMWFMLTRNGLWGYLTFLEAIENTAKKILTSYNLSNSSFETVLLSYRLSWYHPDQLPRDRRSELTTERAYEGIFKFLLDIRPRLREKYLGIEAYQSRWYIFGRHWTLHGMGDIINKYSMGTVSDFVTCQQQIIQYLLVGIDPDSIVSDILDLVSKFFLGLVRPNIAKFLIAVQRSEFLIGRYMRSLFPPSHDREIIKRRLKIIVPGLTKFQIEELKDLMLHGYSLADL